MKRIHILYICFSLLFLSCNSNSFISQNYDNKSIETSSRNISKDNEKIIFSINNISPYNNGIFEGWGTSLCWWANRIGHNQILVDKSIDLFFTNSGLDLNIVRFNIGGGDNPNHNHILRSDSKMPGYANSIDAITKSEYNWNNDIRQINVLNSINETRSNDLIIELFSNSPPYYLTKSKCSSGSKNPTTNNISSEYYSLFTKYLSDIAFYFSNELKLNINTIEPFNEPQAPSWKFNSTKQEGCHISAGKAQSDIINLLRKNLDELNLNHIGISASDEVSTIFQLNSFSRLSKTARNNITRVNTHTYYTLFSNLLFKTIKKSGLNFWISETDDFLTTGENNGEMGPALSLGKKIISDMNTLKPSAWIIWQVIASYLDDNEFENIIEGSQLPDFDNGYWGLAIADFNNNQIILTKKYYAFAQFSKFIHPGNRIIYLNSDNCIGSINQDDSEIVIVYVNQNNFDKKIELKLDLPKTYTPTKAFRTSGNSISKDENVTTIDTPQVEIKSTNNFNFYVNKNSITTFIFTGN